MIWRGITSNIAAAVEGEKVFFHCRKTVIHSQPWKPEAWSDVSGIATFGNILADEINASDTTDDEPDPVLEEADATKR